MEEFPPVNPIVILSEDRLNFFCCEVHIVHIMFPCEMNAYDVLSLGWAQRNVILFDSPELCYLDIVAEFVPMTVKISDCGRHIVELDEEFGLDLITVGRRRLVRQEVVDLLVPHAES